MVVREEGMDIDLMKHTTGCMLGIKLKFVVEDEDLRLVDILVVMKEDDTNSGCAEQIEDWYEIPGTEKREEPKKHLRS